MLFLVATNVIASRQPERWPTGTPHACAKIGSVSSLGKSEKTLDFKFTLSSPLREE